MKHNLEWVSQKAEELNCKISENKELLDVIIQGLNKSEGQCPCVPKHARGIDTVCPCANMIHNRVCKCGIFV